MPYNDKEKQAEATRQSNVRRKSGWLEAHPCGCGNPSVTVRRLDTTITPKCVWVLPEDRIAEVVALCASCLAASRKPPRPPAAPKVAKAPKVEIPPQLKKEEALRRLAMETEADQRRREELHSWRQERRARLGYGAPAQ